MQIKCTTCWAMIQYWTISLIALHVVRGIMGNNESNISIVDKSIKFGRDVYFGILIRKKFGPTRKYTPDVFWRGIYRTFSTFDLMDRFRQNLVC